MKDTKILIADDDSLVMEMLSDVLQSNEYIVETAQNGADALEKYCSDPAIGLIISDMNMPEMGGMELVKELRNTKLDVPVIILTGSSEISTALEVIRSGANDYLLKDENIEDTILLSIKNVLEKKEMKDLNMQLMADLALKNNELEKLNEQLEIHNRFIRETFGRYLSNEVVRSLIETPGGLKLGGEIQKVSIMMTDIRDCETTLLKTTVHAHYDELRTLPAEVKGKIWLYHYQAEPGYIPEKDGFLGFVAKGQEFDFSSIS